MTTIPVHVLTVLDRAEIDGNKLRLAGPRLERKLYTEVNKVLSAAGGKWTAGKVQAHVFDGDAAEIVDNLILTGEYTRPRDIGFFPTPEELAADLVRRTKVGPMSTCLEPSAGSGRIVDAMLNAGARLVYAVENDPKLADGLRQKYGSTRRVIVIEEDFAEWAGAELHDRSAESITAVAMNPPFLGILHLDHVKLALALLSSCGRFTSVLPCGVEFRDDRRHRDFRFWCKGLGGTIERLPSGSFKESGTSVETSLLTIDMSTKLFEAPSQKP